MTPASAASAPQWLSIAVTFPTGRYHGEEWPPSPSRLFQALLAGVMTGGYRALWPTASSLLQWLELQNAPLIISAAAEKRAHFSLAVPNNDTDVAASAWKRGADYNLAQLRTMKTVRPRSICCETDPHVRYLWQVDGEGVAAAKILPALTDCLHTLGWGIDMAYANSSLMSEPEVAQLRGDTWIPSSGGGTLLRVPVTGSLDDCVASYGRFQKRITPNGINSDTRPVVYGEQAYRPAHELGVGYAMFDLKSIDNGPRGFSRDWGSAMIVAAWLRHAAAEAMREEGKPSEWIDEYVLGHAGNAPAKKHLAFVPLPTIGMVYSDARIRRAIVVEPPDGDGRVAALLAYKLPGRTLTDKGGKDVCRLMEADRGAVWNFYLKREKATIWRSVTPVVLHGYNSVRGRISIPKTERLIVQAFAESGYPPQILESVAFQAAPMWAGAGEAPQMALPVHLKNRPRYHVEVRLRKAISGPVLIGIGRHYGLGLFAAAKC